jgi:hypothetical protein
MARPNNKICCFCGNPALTMDHIPPNCIFPDPKPQNLITVPACARCNQESSLDDEYFRFIVATANSERPPAKLITQRIIKRAREKPTLLQSLMRKTIKVDVYSEGGIFLEQRPAFIYDRVRVQKTVDKIVRGLFWLEQRCILGDNYKVRKFELYLPSPNKNPPVPDEKLQAAILSLPRKMVGDGNVFAYRYSIDTKDPSITGWFLEFFETTLIVTMTDVKNDTTHQ